MMKINHKSTLKPKLRFPEFRKAEGWKNTTLGDVTTKTDKRNKGGKSYPVYSISNKTGFTPQSEQFEGVDSEQRGYDIALYKLIESKTFAYNPARINVGSIGYSGALNNVIISSLYVCFKAKSDAADQFLLHFFGTSEFAKSVNNLVEGGIRSYLFYENFARIGIPLPSLAEQLKIADCLSSLDELIAAESQKLDALKTHKKGLMQQLFPREGETIPRLRFPEFRRAPRWKNESMSELYSFKRTFSLSRDQLSNEIGTVRNIHYGDIHTKYPTSFKIREETVPYINSSKSLEDVSHDNYCIEGDIVFADASEDLEDVGKSIEIVALNNERLLSGMHTILARQKYKKLIVGFGGYLFKSSRIREQIKKEAQGAKVFGISATRLSNIEICYPPEKGEQQKIADCLSFLDDLIAAQCDKVEALKTHKKGLMQQLFPIVEGIEA